MRTCYFCGTNIKEVDFKETELLKKFLDQFGRIKPRQRTALCAGHHRQLALAVKRARYLALLPFLTSRLG